MGRKDSELQAMTAVATALHLLDERAAARVLRWAFDRFASSETKESVGLLSSLSVSETSKSSDQDERKQFSDLPTLYDTANPTTEAERALVVGYWFQVVEGNDSFYSYGVNAKLKDMGYKIGNITRAFEALMEDTPRLAIQVSKGESQQARKRLRLTTEGIRKVESMIRQKSATR